MGVRIHNLWISNRSNWTDYIILIEFLNNKYSPVGFIKEILYALATGSNNTLLTPGQTITSVPPGREPKKEEIFEEIENAHNIEL